MLGYLHAADGKRYRLGLKVLDLGFNAFGRIDLHSIARAHPAFLGGLRQRGSQHRGPRCPELVYLERIQLPLGRLGITRIGARVPAYCTAVGHAILAWLSLAERLEILNERDRTKLTPSTPTSTAEIESRLQKVRDLGYAVSDQDTVLGVRVIAAPIFDAHDRPWLRYRPHLPGWPVPFRSSSTALPPPFSKRLATSPRCPASPGRPRWAWSVRELIHGAHRAGVRQARRRPARLRLCPGVGRSADAAR